MAIPARAFRYMEHLLSLNFQVLGPTPIGQELMLAIFWEETIFNNIFQSPGTAVGFGQTEPVEFYRFDVNGKHSQLAKQKGYLVHNLPKRIPLPPFKPGGPPRARIATPLDDYTSVRTACAFVRDLWERGVKSKRGIVNAYGSVGFTGPQPAHLSKPGGRLSLVDGWLRCEKALEAANENGRKVETSETVYRDQVMNALKKARDFNQDDVFRKQLFPERVYMEVD